MFADIVLLVIMIPSLLVMFFYEYPAKWEERRFIFGVKNRGEFREKKTFSEISKIVSRTRKQALAFIICSFVIMGLIMLIPDETIRMTIWVFFIIVDLILFSIPFMRSNLEMKSLKREIGIKSSAGTTYTDLKGAGAVHALKIPSLIIPNAITALCFTISVLLDTGMIQLEAADIDGKYALTSMTGSFLFVGLILIPVAILMDRIRNEVISSESVININFNRAKKKVFADMFIFMSWANAVFVVLYAIMLFFTSSELVLIIQFSVYMLFVMASLARLVKQSLAIDKHYRTETNIDIDDDDKWIFGAFYYNPDDRRLNVAKRMGVGGTINMGHPAGKFITVVTALLLIVTLAFTGFLMSLGKSSMQVSISEDTLICTQVFDYYKIPVSDINNPEICAMEKGFSLSRQVGIGMEPVFIGTFIVNGEPDCRIFLNTDTDSYIRFEANGKVYCISGNSDQETREIFDKITSE